jgi:hypothetical protein
MLGGVRWLDETTTANCLRRISQLSTLDEDFTVTRYLPFVDRACVLVIDCLEVWDLVAN